MKNSVFANCRIIKEYVDEVERKLISLEKNMYSGHDLNIEAFHEKEQILNNFTKDTETRVKNIVEIIKGFPDGLWRKMKFPGLDNYIRILEKIEKGNNIDKLSGKFKCIFYDEGNDEFGYEFTTGFDDGYPTSSSFALQSELLWISDSELESKLDNMVVSALNESIAYTNTTYLREKGISNAIEDIIQRKNIKTKMANLFPFTVKEVEDKRCTASCGKHVSYNIVDKNGLGHASFGIEYDLARWFCEAANEYAKKCIV